MEMRIMNKELRAAKALRIKDSIRKIEMKNWGLQIIISIIIISIVENGDEDYE